MLADPFDVDDAVLVQRMHEAEARLAGLVAILQLPLVRLGEWSVVVFVDGEWCTVVRSMRGNGKMVIAWGDGEREHMLVSPGVCPMWQLRREAA